MWFVLNLIFELILYLIVDNLTKLFIVHNRKETRFDILIFECLFLGFLIGFLSIYHHFTYLLIFFLLVHILGTLYTEKRFDVIKEGTRTLFHLWIAIWRFIITNVYNLTLRRIINHPPMKFSTPQKLPQEYLYSYRVTPTNSLYLRQSSSVQALPRLGILNSQGTTHPLNALLQSLASLNSFCSSLQRSVNLLNSTYNPIVPAFLDLMTQLRNAHRASEYTHQNALADTSFFVSQLSTYNPDLLNRHTATNIAEALQSLLDVLNTALSKQKSVCSTNVIEQVHNRKLTTFSLDYLNKIFVETEAQLHNKITMDNLDAQASYIIQYVDLSWLMHHIQLGSIIKHTFSGQILHAHCCPDCSRIRFRTEPFQVLPLPVPTSDTTLERLFTQFPKVETVDSISCSFCSSQSRADEARESHVDRHGTLLTKITSTLAPMFTTRPQPPGEPSTSSPPPPPTTVIPTITTRHPSTMKSQTMLAGFPQVLCVQLRRFSYDRLSQTTTKLTTQISLEPEKILDLSHLHYTTWLGLANLSATIPSRYRLAAVCLHVSNNPPALSTNRPSDHYTCLYRTNHSRWLLSDNERTSEIHQIEQLFQTPYVKENCCLLFYERCV